jgi:hypothetical protein
MFYELSPDVCVYVCLVLKQVACIVPTVLQRFNEVSALNESFNFLADQVPVAA